MRLAPLWLLLSTVFTILAEPFPTDGLLPKAETGVMALLDGDAENDGRGIKVAIFDSGIDPGVEGLRRTTQGLPKILDLVDATGSGDVDTSTVAKVKEGKVLGLTGRELTVGEGFSAKEVHLGLKAAWELFPSVLVGRLKEERKEAFMVEHAALEAIVRADKLLDKKERDARLKALAEARKSYTDPGPIFDCLVYGEGDDWRALIDTDEDGDLSDETSLAEFRKDHKFASFGEQAQLNFSVNFYDEGKILSIVVPANMHGSHVAGIVGGYFPEEPELNGLAPGVQLVSVKIGDSRLNGMETGSAIIRGLEIARRHGCQLINMSYGEPTRLPNQGRIIELINDLVYEHQVTFVASAGNAGPALTTVGAPGSATDSIISVGAYVTPAMMKAGYALRRTRPDLAYTWSSRGPASDGAHGVSICAPGGAFAPVPNYTLRRNRHANGTSMSSPNACGSLAVLLGILGREEIEFSPALIKRVIQNTAEPIVGEDVFSQGQGLLRVDRALTLLRQHDLPIEPRYTVRIPSRNQARGLYLREHRDTTKRQQFKVTVLPEFSKGSANGGKLKLNRRFKLVSTAPWLECPEHLFITHKETSFEIEVDPTIVPQGLCEGEIQALDEARPEAGPVFRVPATLIRTHKSGLKWAQKGPLQAGEIKRHFLKVPMGATELDFTFTNRSALPHRIVAHLMQIMPQRRHDEVGRRFRFQSEPNVPVETRMPVVGGQILELALASNWSSHEPLHYEAELKFHGLQPSTRLVRLTPGAPVARLDVQALQDQETVAPTAELSHWQSLIEPSHGEIRTLSNGRGTLTNGHRVHEARVTYDFHLGESATVIPRFPSLNRRLYEADIQSQLFTITDGNGQRVAADDGWEPHAVQLRTGDYQVHYHWTHHDADVLEPLLKTPLTLEGNLKSKVKIGVYPTRRAAIQGKKQLGESVLSEGEIIPLHLVAPEFKALPGRPLMAQQLIGKASLGHAEIDLVYDLPFPAVNSKTKNPRQHTIDHLEGLLSTEDFKGFDRELRAFREVYDDDEDDLMVDWFQLKRVDTVKNRKEDHGKVLKRCDDILSEIDFDDLAEHRGRRSLDDDDQEERKRFDLQFEILTDTLYRQCRAIAYHDGEREKAGQSYDAKPFEKAFKSLRRWVDTEGEDYVLAHIRWHRRHERFGQALNLLNAHMKTTEPSRLLHDKRVKIQRSLSWDLWADHEEQANRRRFVPYLKTEKP